MNHPLCNWHLWHGTSMLMTSICNVSTLIGLFKNLNKFMHKLNSNLNGFFLWISNFYIKILHFIHEQKASVRVKVNFILTIKNKRERITRTVNRIDSNESHDAPDKMPTLWQQIFCNTIKLIVVLTKEMSGRGRMCVVCIVKRAMKAESKRVKVWIEWQRPGKSKPINQWNNVLNWLAYSSILLSICIYL